MVGGTALSQLWLFIVAPLVGGFIAAMVYGLLTRYTSTEVPADAVPPDSTGARAPPVAGAMGGRRRQQPA